LRQHNAHQPITWAPDSSCSRHTIDFHLRQIFRKLNIRSRVELALMALEHARATARDHAIRGCAHATSMRC
jgi:hypothetical protein